MSDEIGINVKTFSLFIFINITYAYNLRRK